MLLKKLRQQAQLAYQRIRDFFSGLEIKFKLSINIAIIVVMVIVIFSALILPIQHHELEEATRNTCTVLLKKLSQSVHGPMLLSVNDPGVLTEVKLHVQQTMQMGINGLKYIVVFDRNGEVIGSSEPEPAKFTIQAETLAALAREEEVSLQQNDSFYEFSYPIIAKNPSTSQKVLLGLACIGFSKEVLLEPTTRTKRLILTMAALVIVVSVWVIYFFAQKMVDEINALARAARDVGGGNLEVHVKPRSNDELGQLALEFNRMVMHLREKLQMQKFLSKLTVEMIQERGGGGVEPYEGDRRHVTILFSDVRNFSAIAEDCEPEQIINLINVYFDLQTRIIEAHGGVVDKFMGDQILAIFRGLRTIENAVGAAVEIQCAVKELNRRREAAGEITFELGIGLNNGPAVMGNMGSKNRMDYTVIGDVVNIANRLCSLARSGQIIAEAAFARSLNGMYHITRLDSIMVKGRSKPVEISEIDYEKE
ncbi:MAG: adenylate/guanylate cyclase domain-containing protein [bacterium]